MQTKKIFNQGTGYIAASSAVISFARQWYWWVWIFAFCTAFLIQLITLDVLPHLQQDEAQITDYGRLILDPYSSWSVTWRMAEGKPLLLWSYLGPLIAELSYQFGGGSGIGPRYASLLGGLVAATMALGWLLARRVPYYVAFGLSFAFMLDPLFVLSQRMARVDSWVIAFCLASCWVLRAAVVKEKNRVAKKPIFAAGGLAATAALIWPSAVFLFPLIVHELILSGKSEDAVKDKWKLLASKAIYFGLGGIIVTILLLIPVWQSLLIIFNDMTTMVSQNVDASKTLLDRFFVLFDYQLWLKLIKAFVKTFSPLFPLFAIAGILINRERGLLLVTGITLAMIFASLVYEFRALYLIPYFVVLISVAFTHSAGALPKLWVKRLSIFALGVLVLWSVGTSLLIRTALGLEGKAQRDRNKLYHVAASSVGQGHYKVFLGFTYEFYFVGRSLGWQLYTPYIQFTYDSQGNWIRESDYHPKDRFLELLSEMDYAIFAQGAVDEALAEELSMSGLHYRDTFRVGEERASTEQSQPLSRNREIFLWFLQGKESYGSYVVYARDKRNSRIKMHLGSK